MRKLTLIVLGILGVLALLWLLTPTLNWDGDVPRTVQLTVLDGSSEMPLSDAMVSMNLRELGVTDLSGKCTWVTYFPAGGQRSFLFNRGYWRVSGMVTIIAPDGRSIEINLADAVQEPRRPLGNRKTVLVSVSMPTNQGQK